MKLVSLCTVAVIALSVGCKKDESKSTSTTSASVSAAPASGCGADYTDPKKEFCMKLPADFKPTEDKSPGELYTEIIRFDSDMDHFTVSIGFQSSNFTTFDEAVAADEKWMKESKNIKIESSGATAAGGKFWLYDNQGYSSVQSSTKSNGNKVIKCDSNDRKPAIIDACKSIRAYPT